jgi:F-type H+-transporting ATPase subunit a
MPEMNDVNLQITPLFSIGPLDISITVVMTWVIMALISFVCWQISRHLHEQPGSWQTAAERLVIVIETAIDQVAPGQGAQILPFIGTLWIFLVIANLAGLIPGVHSPTRDLSATAGLAFLVFLSTHWYGLRIQGWKRYLHHYLSPSPILLPFHLVSEVTRTLALAVRLFGNMMSLEMAALLILLVAGFLAPVPILMLHIIEALVQAYIFGMLALIYLAGAIQSQQHLSSNQGDDHA